MLLRKPRRPTRNVKSMEKKKINICRRILVSARSYRQEKKKNVRIINLTFDCKSYFFFFLYFIVFYRDLNEPDGKMYTATGHRFFFIIIIILYCCCCIKIYNSGTHTRHDLLIYNNNFCANCILCGRRFTFHRTHIKNIKKTYTER